MNEEETEALRSILLTSESLKGLRNVSKYNCNQIDEQLRQLLGDLKMKIGSRIVEEYVEKK